MGALLFLHPFRIGTSGAVITAEQGSDTYLESQLAVIVGTRIGERDMCPPFGVPDAAFARLSAADIQTCLDQFGPDGMTVTAVAGPVDELSATLDVAWERVSR